MSDLGLSFVPAQVAPETFNVLLYGPPKQGKSTAAATAPGPLLWLNLEGGGAIAYARKVASERGTQIHELRPGRDDDLRVTLRQIIQHVRSGADPVVRTVVVDTIGKVRDQLARTIGGATPQIQHWGQVAKVIEGFTEAMRDEPVNLVLIAHEKVADSDAGDRIVEPLVGGASTAKVCGEVDVIAYCGRVEGDKDTPDRWMGVFVPRNGRRAGDRSGGLGAARDLDLTDWLGEFRQALTPDAEPMPFDPIESEAAHA